MSERSVFSLPVVIGLCAGITAIFALSMVLLSRDKEDRSTTGASSYSRSALGYAGLYALLENAGVPVDRSRIGAQRNPGSGGVLVLAEPFAGAVDSDSMLALERATRVLLVLPKRYGARDPDKPAWIRSSGTVPLVLAEGSLGLVAAGGVVQRLAPAAPTVNELGVAPTFTGTMQTMRVQNLRPLLAVGLDVILGEIDDGYRRVWVLSDPDIAANHGLARGENAAFVAAVLDRLRGPGGGKVVFDEAIHGISGPPANVFRYLFEFPFVIVTILVALAVGLLLWATASRFGAPRPAPAAFGFGKGRLIANAASLLERAGHQGFVMRRYVRQLLHEAGQTLHAPARLDDAELARWLDRIAEARGVAGRAGDILMRADRAAAGGNAGLRALFAAAGEMYRWKEEIVHGPSAHSQPRGRHQA